VSTQVASQTQALDTPSLPGTIGNPFPPMGQTLSEAIPPVPIYQALCPGCSLSSGLDPDPSATLLNTPIPAVVPPLLPGTDVAMTFKQAASAAQQALTNHPKQVDNIQQTLDDFHDALTPLLALGGDVHPVTFNATQWVRSFKPAFGRNLAGPGLSILGSDLPNPPLLAELTNRGARSYCAMRNAANDAPSSGSLTMLDNTLTPILWWDVGYSHADATLLPVSDKTNRWPPAPGPGPSPQGSQSFYIPVALGVQVAPLKGPLIPDFGEFSHQLAWVTGDAAVRSEENPVKLGQKGPTFYLSNYRDLEHYDVWSGTSYSGTTGFDQLTLVDLGLFSVLLGADITVVSGALEDPVLAAHDSIISNNAQSAAWFPQPSYTAGSPPKTTRGALYDAFGLSPDHFVDEGTWPTPRENSFALSGVNNTGNHSLQSGGAFDDALGLIIGFHDCADESGFPLPFSSYALSGSCHIATYPDQHSGGGVTWLLDQAHRTRTSPGTTARWRNDDDRTFALRDSVDMSLNVTGAGGINLGILKLLIEATATLDVDTYVDTIVSESLSLVQRNGPTPELVLPPPVANSDLQFLQTNFRMTPISNTAIHFTPLSVYLHFELDLGFFTVSFDIPILPFPSIQFNTDPVIPDESSRLRVGEYSDLLSSDAGYPVDSHLPPPGGAFASLPETVDQCLADNVSTGHLPSPAPGAPAQGPVKGGICLAGPLPLGLDLYRVESYFQGPEYEMLYTPAEPSPVLDLPLDICTSLTDQQSWTNHFENPLQNLCAEFAVDYLCGKLNGTEQNSQVIEYDPLSPSVPLHAIAHLLTKAPQEGDLAQKMWAVCGTAFTMPNGAQGTNPVTVQALGQLFTHQFVDLYQCDPITLQPVPGTGHLTPGNNCPNPDPVTNQCWSLPACYIDPTTGSCDLTCVSSTGAGCMPAPPPTLCAPPGIAASGTEVPCPTPVSCPPGEVLLPQIGSCVSLPDAGCTIDPLTGSCLAPGVGICAVDPASSPICTSPETGCTIDPTTGTCVDAGVIFNCVPGINCPTVDAGVDAGTVIVNCIPGVNCPGAVAQDAGTPQ
jgi:hypothetical protein